MKDLKKLLAAKVQKTKEMLALKKKARAIELLEREKRRTPP